MMRQRFVFSNHTRATDRSTADSVTLYICAGGRGSRLQSLFPADPLYGVCKALLQLGDPPIRLIDYAVEQAPRQLLGNIVIGCGDVLPVMSYGLTKYRHDPMVTAVANPDYGLIGEAGDLVTALQGYPTLFGDRLLIKNVDTVLDIDDREFLDFHRRTGATLSIALSRSQPVPNQNAFYVTADDRVVYSREAYANPITAATASQLAAWRGSSTGAIVVETAFLASLDQPRLRRPYSLYTHVMAAALRRGLVMAYDNATRFFIDVGTVSAWHQMAASPALQSYLTPSGAIEAAGVS